MTAIMQSMVAMKPITITQTPTIWIDANNSSSYNGTGTVVTDLSGNGYTQNLSSASAYTILSGVKCFDFSGTYVMRAASAAPTLPTTGFTYIAWARMISSSARHISTKARHSCSAQCRSGPNATATEQSPRPAWKNCHPACTYSSGTLVPAASNGRGCGSWPFPPLSHCPWQYGFPAPTHARTVPSRS